MYTTQTQETPWPPRGAVAVTYNGVEWTIYEPGDEVPAPEPDPYAALREQYEAEQQAQADADFAAFKARAGQPSYKAAAVKVAAEKLGLIEAIEAAIMVLVGRAGDKSLYVWWTETDAISRGDAQWIEIEPGVDWGKSSAAELFDLAAQI